MRLQIPWQQFDRLTAKLTAVACQRDGTTSLPRAWDHLGVSVSIADLAVVVNCDALVWQVSLPVGGALDDQGVRA